MLASRLSSAGFVAADDEASELVAAASGDQVLLGALISRRLAGEPLAWITGTTLFCGATVQVDPGVYVPRWQSEPLVRRARDRLPVGGTAIDLCTGSGAVAKVLAADRSPARVVASEIDGRAARCAAANGVEVYRGNLFGPLPPGLAASVDVVVGIVPYVPTPALGQLPRDTLTFESQRSYDGGADGTDILRRVIEESPQFLRTGGALLLELGGDQSAVLAGVLESQGFAQVEVIADEDGDVRGIEATWSGGRPSASTGRFG